ncbi:hypothetical protein SAMN02787100_1010 [Chryseobacterium sp. OV279]|nr:hypothetical protein SAMN02787100_1010 [Chryseobacterium sp. OV279]
MLNCDFLLFKIAFSNSTHWSVKIGNISVKKSAFNFDIFKTNNTFAERKINLEISYTISS